MSRGTVQAVSSFEQMFFCTVMDWDKMNTLSTRVLESILRKREKHLGLRGPVAAPTPISKATGGSTDWWGCDGGNNSGFLGNWLSWTIFKVHQIQEDVGVRLVSRNCPCLMYNARNCCYTQYLCSRTRVRSVKESSRPTPILSTTNK